MIRPKPARWFEILAARDDATLVLEALATTGAVELEARPSAVLPAALADLRPQLSEFAELASRYHAYWPQVKSPASAFPEPPSVTLARSLARLRAWAEDAEPVIRQLQRGEAERAELLLWRRVLVTIGDSVIDFARLAGAGPILHARLFVFPPDSAPELPPGTLARSVDLDGTMVCALAALTVGDADDVQALAQQAALLKGRAYDAPAWLRADAEETERYIAPRLDALAREELRLRSDLEGLHARHELATALVRRQPAAMGDPQRPCARIGRSLLLDHRLDQRFQRCAARRGALPRRRAGAAALPAAGPESAGPAAARQPALGPALRDLQPRARDAVAQRSGPVRPARARGAADVRLHVRRRRAGIRHRRGRLRPEEAISDRTAVHRRRARRDGLRNPVRQRVQSPPHFSRALDRSARRSARDPARSARGRRGAADDRARAQCARGLVARRPRHVDRLRRGLRRRLSRHPRRIRRPRGIRSGRRRRSGVLCRAMRCTLAARPRC